MDRFRFNKPAHHVTGKNTGTKWEYISEGALVVAPAGEFDDLADGVVTVERADDPRSPLTRPLLQRPPNPRAEALPPTYQTALRRLT